MLLTATLTLATSLSIQVELPEETGMERVSARDHLLDSNKKLPVNSLSLRLLKFCDSIQF